MKSAENHELASIGRRFVAVLIDAVLVAIAVSIPSSIAAAISGHIALTLKHFTSVLFAGVIAPVCEVLYTGVFLQHGGQTIGKFLMQVRVTRPDGSRISRAQAWGRSIAAGLFINVLAIIDCLTAFFTPERTAIHDILANTRVMSVR